MGGDGIAGDDAALIERGDQSSLRANDLTRSRQARRALPAGRANVRPSRRQTAARSASSATRSSRSPSRIWSRRSWCAKRSLMRSSLAPARSAIPQRVRFRNSFRRSALWASAAGATSFLVETFASGFRPVRAAGACRSPKFGPARQHADQLAHRLAQRWIAKPELAMLALHHMDEPLGQRHRRVIALPRPPARAGQGPVPMSVASTAKRPSSVSGTAPRHTSAARVPSR